MVAPRALRKAGGAALAALTLFLGAPLWAESPTRVVSINLCTDQLALTLAAPGQILSVSALAQDPAMSLMADAARRLPANSARAEEIYLLKPDLVLASTFTNPATLSMLRRLGLKVELFAPPESLADVRAGILQMGAALGREEAAARLAESFDARRAALAATAPKAPAFLAASYGASGYASGAATLSGEIIKAAGFRHLGDDLGLQAGGFLPLEQLVMAAPDVLILGKPYPGTSRAEEILRHPALRAAGHPRQAEGQDWTCGLPSVLTAAEHLADLRRQMEAAQ